MRGPRCCATASRARADRLASRALAQRLGAIRLSSDAERKRLAGVPDAARLPACAYAAGQVEAIYGGLLAHAQTVLESGYTAIVDATFLRERNRSDFIALARRLGVRIVLLDFTADRATLFARVESRATLGRDASDAGPAVLADQLARAEPLSATERALAMRFDTGGEPSAYETEAFWTPLLDALARPGLHPVSR
ncbi:ATP-binding protein [Paraburkholderia sp. A1RI-2L]|uniref:AAA family ATPase n=1 Tax=Paraburkholderia sp. A1RI-2L TaxID=3028367 RepID=UPI003B7E543C